MDIVMSTITAVVLSTGMATFHPSAAPAKPKGTPIEFVAARSNCFKSPGRAKTERIAAAKEVCRKRAETDPWAFCSYPFAWPRRRYCDTLRGKLYPDGTVIYALEHGRTVWARE